MPKNSNENSNTIATYLEHFGKEAGADFLHMKIVEAVEFGDGRLERQAGAACHFAVRHRHRRKSVFYGGKSTDFHGVEHFSRDSTFFKSPSGKFFDNKVDCRKTHN